MKQSDIKDQIELLRTQILVCEAEKVSSKHIDKMKLKLDKLIQVAND